MSEQTHIPWCDSTWNWARGCDKVSPGCANCYITSTAPFRVSGQKHGDPRVIASPATFNAPLQWEKKPWVCEECGDPWDGTYSASRDIVCGGCGTMNSFHRRRVFSLSLGDWLDPKIPVEWLARALDIIRRCPDLDFLLCTKRPELFDDRLQGAINAHEEAIGITDHRPLTIWLHNWVGGHEAPKNVWIIVSAEDQERLDQRVPHLLKIPAVVRGLSCEPLLGEIDLELRHGCRGCNHPGNIVMAMNAHGRCTVCDGTGHEPPGIDWVIVGGESGKEARPCKVEWVRSIKDQCQAAQVPVFVKQIGRKVLWHDNPTEIVGGSLDGLVVPNYELRRLAHPKGGDPAEWPEDLRVREFPRACQS